MTTPSHTRGKGQGGGESMSKQSEGTPVASTFLHGHLLYPTEVVQTGGFTAYRRVDESTENEIVSTNTEENSEDEDEEDEEDDDLEEGVESSSADPEKISAPLQPGGSTAQIFPSPDLKPHKCHQCGKGYRLRGSLMYHARWSHGGHIGRLSCPAEYCTKTYAEVDSLNRHLRSRHSELAPEKPKKLGTLECPVAGCRTLCSLQYDLNAHINTAHFGVWTQYVDRRGGQEG